MNDKRVTGVRFETSHGWDKVKDVTVSVEIPDHATVKFQRDEGDGAWNLDYLEVQ